MPTPFLLNGILASQISGHLYSGPTGAFDALGSVTVGSGGVSSITFSAIPQTYTHLQVRGIAQDTSGTDAYIQLNGANTTYRHQLYGNGSTAIASAYTGISYIILTPNSGSAFGASITDILDYTNTNKVKTIRTFSGYDLNGSGYVGIGSASNANDTSAVTSITIYSAGTSFAQYSQFSLYGVK